MSKYLIKEAAIVNEGKIQVRDVLIEDGRIERIDASINIPGKVKEYSGAGKHLFPGVIDDQVHFPG